jgi:hypothetical protein
VRRAVVAAMTYLDRELTFLSNAFVRLGGGAGQCQHPGGSQSKKGSLLASQRHQWFGLSCWWFRGMTALTGNNIVVVPIRSGIGLRLGANVGYLKFTDSPTWNPF